MECLRLITILPKGRAGQLNWVEKITCLLVLIGEANEQPLSTACSALANCRASILPNGWMMYSGDYLNILKVHYTNCCLSSGNRLQKKLLLKLTRPALSSYNNPRYALGAYTF